jgi:hypothetical protein
VRKSNESERPPRSPRGQDRQEPAAAHQRGITPKSSMKFGVSIVSPCSRFQRPKTARVCTSFAEKCGSTLRSVSVVPMIPLDATSEPPIVRYFSSVHSARLGHCKDLAILAPLAILAASGEAFRAGKVGDTRGAVRVCAHPAEKCGSTLRLGLVVAMSPLDAISEPQKTPITRSGSNCATGTL